MQAKAISKFVRVSPYKLRTYADAVRGNRVDKAIAWLNANQVKKSVPIMKTIQSAFYNAKSKFASDSASMEQFFIKEIRVDDGPITKYFKPAAMGRASIQRRRMSHVQVVVETKATKGEN